MEKDRSIGSSPVPNCTIDGMGMRLSCRCGCAAAKDASKKTPLTMSSDRIVSNRRQPLFEDFIHLREMAIAMAAALIRDAVSNGLERICFPVEFCPKNRRPEL